MIKSFAHKGLERGFTKGDKSGINAQYGERINRVLDRLDSAIDANDMNIAGFYFHALTGDKKGLYSVRVTGNWRITFSFENGDAHIVNLEDYH